MHAGFMARSVSDIALFNQIFSSCNSTTANVSLAGYRIGYPTNWWANLSPEVRARLQQAASYPLTTEPLCLA
jgi:Asp-tRNA(Asn)/Glu-tRNA(Gln) amidotransferase A subunit family amidase